MTENLDDKDWQTMTIFASGKTIYLYPHYWELTKVTLLLTQDIPFELIAAGGSWLNCEPTKGDIHVPASAPPEKVTFFSSQLMVEMYNQKV